MENMLEKRLFVTVSHCGADGAMTADRLLEFFQDLASQHGEGLGVGLKAMTDRHKFWLTVRSRVRIFRAPRLGETVTGATWPAAPGLLRCDRYYTVTGADGTLLADGRTEWAVFDTEAGRVTGPKGLFPEGMEYRWQTAGGPNFGKLPTDFSDAPEVRRRSVEAEDAAAAFAGDRVGLQAVPVGGVHDEDTFVGQDVRHVQIIRVDGETPLVIEVACGQTRTVYFAFEKFQCHGFGRLQKRVEVY
jgi:acyl-CoA thioesterase FadM